MAQVEEGAASGAVDAAALRAAQEVLGQATTLAQISDALVGSGVQAVRGARSVVLLLDVTGTVLELVASSGYDADYVEGFSHLPISSPLPVAEAVRTGRPVVVPTVEAFKRRHPGIPLPDEEPHALVAVPLLRAGVPLGAWGIRVDTADGSGPQVAGAVQAGLHLGEVAAASLDRSATVSLLSRRVQELQTALDSRVLVEQAKGVLAGRHGVTITDAFHALRRVSRSSGRRLHDVAQAVVDGSEDPLA
jgi:hypothetical protein